MSFRGPYLSRADAAAHLGMNVRTFDRKVKRFKIPRYCEGKKFALADLEAWAENEVCFLTKKNDNRRPSGGFTPVAA